jgi:hypothetical protein
MDEGATNDKVNNENNSTRRVRHNHYEPERYTSQVKLLFAQSAMQNIADPFLATTRIGRTSSPNESADLLVHGETLHAPCNNGSTGDPTIRMKSSTATLTNGCKQLADK